MAGGAATGQSQGMTDCLIEDADNRQTGKTRAGIELKGVIYYKKYIRFAHPPCV
jgi:hypothetical protein